MTGTWILPCLSVPREGSGRGRRRVNHSHTQSQVSWGDRTSGFNGLRTSGSPGLHPGRGAGTGPTQEALPSDDEPSPDTLLPPASLFSSLGHLSVTSWASQKQVSIAKGYQSPGSSRQCPWEQDAHAACGGDPQSTAVS